MDAAEELFGSKGCDSVSLRDITRHAGVAPALAGYHFGTKEQLLDAVVARRAEILCRERRERLRALAGTGDVTALLDAFMAPFFAQLREGGAQWTAYVKLLSRLGDDAGRLDLLHPHFNAVAVDYVTALGEAMPRAEKTDIARAFSFAVQLMLQTAAGHRRVEVLTEGRIEAADLEAAYPRLLAFVAAGLKGLDAR